LNLPKKPTAQKGTAMSAGDYIFLPPPDALRWFKVLAVFRFATASGQQPDFELPPDRLPLRKQPASRRHLILLVDDQELLREAIGEFLALEGYDVIGAANGADAMHRMEDGLHPDLLLCDALLPDIHGGGLAREAAMLYPEMRVLFISGQSEDVLRDDLGDADFLQKPFRLDVLARRVRFLLEGIDF
jgi:CheY-like chemotaxis protein